MTLSKEISTLIVTFLKKQVPDIQAIYLFGSQASGEASEKSDVDVAVLSASKIQSTTFWRYQGELSHLLKKEVNLIDLGTSTTVLQYQIVNTGKLLFAMNEKVITSFENHTYQLYLTLNDDRKEILEDIAKSGKVYDR